MVLQGASVHGIIIELSTVSNLILTDWRSLCVPRFQIDKHEMSINEILPLDKYICSTIIMHMIKDSDDS